MTKNSFLSVLSQKKVLALFFVGKIVRFLFFYLFIYYLIRETGSLAGYNFHQTIFIFLTFNLVDILAQFLFRDVYRFRPKIISGEFDLTLLKPQSALFRSMMSGADVIDFVTLPFIFSLTIYFALFLDPGVLEVVLYTALVINSLLISSAFHILVMALGIITLEVDYLIWIYRDVLNLGRFPIEIFGRNMRTFLTYLVPLFTMITVPSRVMMGAIDFGVVAVSFLVGVILFFLSLRFWRVALRHYTSASS